MTQSIDQFLEHDQLQVTKTKNLKVAQLKKMKDENESIVLYALATLQITYLKEVNQESEMIDSSMTDKRPIILSDFPEADFLKLQKRDIIYLCLPSDFILPTAKGNYSGFDGYIGHKLEFKIKKINEVKVKNHITNFVYLTRTSILEKNRQEVEAKLDKGEILTAKVLKTPPRLGTILVTKPETILFMTNNKFSTDHSRSSDVLNIGQDIRVKKIDAYPFKGGDPTDDYRLFVSPEKPYVTNLNLQTQKLVHYIGTTQTGWVVGNPKTWGIYVHIRLGLDALCSIPEGVVSNNDVVPVFLYKAKGSGVILPKDKVKNLSPDNYVLGTIAGTLYLRNGIIYVVKMGKIRNFKNSIEIQCTNPDNVEIDSSNEDNQVAVNVTEISVRGVIKI